MPAIATTMPATCTGRIRSRRNSVPSSTVNGADDCSTREASPVGMPIRMAVNRKANCRMPKPVPYSRIQRIRTFGRGMKSRTGTAMTAKRSAAKKNGGK